MVENGSDYTSHFYAYNANSTDVFQLVWDTADSKDASMVPVTLRTIPPQ